MFNVGAAPRAKSPPKRSPKQKQRSSNRTGSLLDGARLHVPPGFRAGQQQPAASARQAANPFSVLDGNRDPLHEQTASVKADGKAHAAGQGVFGVMAASTGSQETFSFSTSSAPGGPQQTTSSASTFSWPQPQPPAQQGAQGAHHTAVPAAANTQPHLGPSVAFTLGQAAADAPPRSGRRLAKPESPMRPTGFQGFGNQEPAAAATPMFGGLGSQQQPAAGPDDAAPMSTQHGGPPTTNLQQQTAGPATAAPMSVQQPPATPLTAQFSAMSIDPVTLAPQEQANSGGAGATPGSTQVDPVKRLFQSPSPFPAAAPAPWAAGSSPSAAAAAAGSPASPAAPFAGFGSAAVPSFNLGAETPTPFAGGRTPGVTRGKGRGGHRSSALKPTQQQQDQGKQAPVPFSGFSSESAGAAAAADKPAPGGAGIRVGGSSSTAATEFAGLAWTAGTSSSSGSGTQQRPQAGLFTGVPDTPGPPAAAAAATSSSQQKSPEVDAMAWSPLDAAAGGGGAAADGVGVGGSASNAPGGKRAHVATSNDSSNWAAAAPVGPTGSFHAAAEAAAAAKAAARAGAATMAAAAATAEQQACVQELSEQMEEVLVQQGQQAAQPASAPAGGRVGAAGPQLQQQMGALHLNQGPAPWAAGSSTAATAATAAAAAARGFSIGVANQTPASKQKIRRGKPRASPAPPAAAAAAVPAGQAEAAAAAAAAKVAVHSNGWFKAVAQQPAAAADAAGDIAATQPQQQQQSGGAAFQFKAEPSVEEVAAAAVEQALLWKGRAGASHKAGRYARAHLEYSKGISALEGCPGQAPLLAVLYNNRAAAALMLQQPQAALQDAQMAQQLDGSLVASYLRLASCHQRLGDLPAAVAVLQAAQQLPGVTPKSEDGQRLTGRLTEVQRVQQQLVQVQQWVAGAGLKGSSGSSRSAEGDSRELQGKQLLEVMEQLAAAMPACEEVKVLRALLLLCLGQLAAAVSAAGQVSSAQNSGSPSKQQQHAGRSSHSIAGHSSVVWQQWIKAQGEYHQGDLVKAQHLLQDLVNRMGSCSAAAQPPAAERVASTSSTCSSSRAGSSTSSTASCSQLLKQLAPDPASLQTQLQQLQQLVAKKDDGNAAVKRKAPQEAVQLYSEALQLSPPAPFAAVLYCNRAAAHHSLEAWTDALADCGRSLALNPSYAKAHSRMAQLLVEVHRPDAAVPILQHLLQLCGATPTPSSPAPAAAGVDAATLRVYKQRLSEAQRAVKQRSQPHHYRLLGCGRSAAEDDIRKAFKKMALRHHPDKALPSCRYSLSLGPQGAVLGCSSSIECRLKEQASSLFAFISAAHEDLTDKVKRRKVDQLLDAEDEDDLDAGAAGFGRSGSSSGGGNPFRYGGHRPASSSAYNPGAYDFWGSGASYTGGNYGGGYSGQYDRWYGGAYGAGNPYAGNSSRGNTSQQQQQQQRPAGGGGARGASGATGGSSQWGGGQRGAAAGGGGWGGAGAARYSSASQSKPWWGGPESAEEEGWETDSDVEYGFAANSHM